jgi:hypothetical protein
MDDQGGHRVFQKQEPGSRPVLACKTSRSVARIATSTTLSISIVASQPSCRRLHGLKVGGLWLGM